jgi:uracil-DNA glycosylase
MISFNYYDVIKRVHPLWLPFFEENKEDLQNILNKLTQIQESDKIQEIYPKPKDIFRALFYCGPEEVKLVILGQDPYINEDQAMGLSFSVPKTEKVPPSLVNIYKEIKNCYPDFEIPKHGLLKRWAKKEKILLLNAALTVIAGISNSHAALWQKFTDNLIVWLQNKNPHCVFLLMGNFAITKAKLIDSNKHKIFKTVHPSPLSASRGFIGCKGFKEIDDYLESKGLKPIKW